MKKAMLVALVMVCCFIFSSFSVFAENVKKSKLGVKLVKIESSLSVLDPAYCWFGHGEDGDGQYKIYYYLENMPDGGRAQIFVNQDYLGEVVVAKTKLPKKATSENAFLESVKTINGKILINESGYYKVDVKVIYPHGESDWLSFATRINPFNIWTHSCLEEEVGGIYILTYRVFPYFGITFEEGDVMNVEIFDIGNYEAVIFLEELDSWNEGLEYVAKMEIDQATYDKLFNNGFYTEFYIDGYNSYSWTSVWE
jgi:hypothetical protein